MLTLILADAELELVPEEIQDHPTIRGYARKHGTTPAKVVLDSSFHHTAMKKLPEGERRGRPDIVHLFLLNSLDSIVNIEGGLKVFVHTRNDEMISIVPETRIPKNYTRFVGLMEDLFENDQVPPEGLTLMTLTKGVALSKVLSLVGGKPIALDPSGTLVNLDDYLRGQKGDLTMVIGGFPHGDFKSPVKDLCNERISIFGRALNVWTVASEVLVAYRRHTVKTI